VQREMDKSYLYDRDMERATLRKTLKPMLEKRIRKMLTKFMSEQDELGKLIVMAHIMSEWEIESYVSRKKMTDIDIAEACHCHRNTVASRKKEILSQLQDRWKTEIEPYFLHDND
jgi:tRNA(Ile)-lysidine synthase TilS/MesJ